MSDTKFDYTYDEVRGAMKWIFLTQQVPDATANMMLETVTDEHIKKFETSSPDYRDETQFLVTQYREAKRRGHVE